MTIKNIVSYAAKSPKSQLARHMISRRDVRDTDVEIDIKYCGICHTDIHFTKNDLGVTVYPFVPGHEIIGIVTSTGKKVKRFKAGEIVGVGCMVDSCKSCNSCLENTEQFCESGVTMTYNSPDLILGGVTLGGYSKKIVVDQHFVLKISKDLNPEKVAPLLCAGITTYSPLKKFNVKKGQRVGIIGLGGLGHLGIKFASAMGADVITITSSENKTEDAFRLGAKDIILSRNENELKKQINTFDLIINTIPSDHNITKYLQMLKPKKIMVVVGLTNVNIHTRSLLFGRNKIVGSLIGGIKETQEMLDFSAIHNVEAEVELIKAKDINKTFERIEKNNVKYRAVIDINSL